MPIPILATKLYIPAPRPKTVLRPRLVEQLSAGLPGKLTLVSAPAGFGKTTLLSEWLAGHERAAAWLSLDEHDDDPARFLLYLAAALQTLDDRVGAGVLEAVQSSPLPPIETLLTDLLNDITADLDPFVLVLDDYHVIDARAIDQALVFLLDHLPPQMHLVITTREDPLLPLARLRARGQLNELRAADLRFTPAEAATFLNQVMGLDLSAADVSALETRTEGWIAGLQLAALSMRGRDDHTEFIQAFAGDHRYIVDYLVEEVLQHQPEQTRNFLLQTAILDRLSGPLCAAVTGQSESGALLELLERSNLFVIPLDDRRHWFRYHHLFADVLRAHLVEEQPDQVPALHQRASAWYQQHALPADAVHHALIATDFERAADLIERAWPEMDGTFQTTTWLDWVQALPDALFQSRPVLSADYAWALLNLGELEAAEARLGAAEHWLAAPPPSAAPICADPAQFQSLPATIATARAYLAQVWGDVPGTIRYGQRALDVLPADDSLQRGIIGALLGVAYWANGDLELADRTLAEGMDAMRTAGNLLFALRGTYGLADIRLAQGRLRAAVRTYEQSLELAAAEGEHVLRGTADLHLRLSELYREQDRMEAAARHLRISEELGEQAASPHWPYRLCLAQARLQIAHGDTARALELLDQAERRYVRTPVPDVHPIAALKARVWIAQGRLTEALAWAQAQDLAVDDELSYLHEFEHLTLARLLLAQSASGQAAHALDAARVLLERLEAAATAGGRMGSLIEILLLQALAYEAQNQLSFALVPLGRALSLAEPEGYIRVFVDEGAPLKRLLTEAAARGIVPDYTGRLLAAFEADHASQATAPASQSLVEPLSSRELEILRLVADGLSNREISEQLFLALDTIKGHNRRIFDKLQVQRRTEAVARARELGLL